MKKIILISVLSFIGLIGYSQVPTGGLVKFPTKTQVNAAFVHLPDSSGVAIGSYVSGKDFQVGLATKQNATDTITGETIVVMKKDSSGVAPGSYTTGKGFQVGMETKANLNSPILTGTPLSPTAASGTNTTQIATTEFVSNENVNPILRDFRSFNSSILALPMFLSTAYSSTLVLIDGYVSGNVFDITKTITISGVGFLTSVQGNYNADKYNGIAIYSISGTTATMIDSTSNDGSLWKQASNTVKQKAFPTTHILTPGKYLVTFIWNTSDSPPTTVPKLNISFSAYGLSLLTGGIKISSFLANQIKLNSPLSFSSLSEQGVIYSIWLY